MEHTLWKFGIIYQSQPGDGEDLGDRGGELTGSVGERRGYCQRI